MSVRNLFQSLEDGEFTLEYERTPKAKRRYEFVRYKVEDEFS